MQSDDTNYYKEEKVKSVTKIKIDPPRIGLNRTFFKNIRLSPYEKTDNNFNSYNPEEKIESSTLESILQSNLTKISKYKNEGCNVIYDELKDKQVSYKISFTDLLNTLWVDETSFENFIEKEKGIWIEEKETDFQPQANNENEVFFESRFEGGNLRKAILVNDNEYDLILKNDINAGKSYHWFYFRIKIVVNSTGSTVSSEKQNNIITENCSVTSDTLKFNIINCQKNDMLFNKGLRVLKYNLEERKWSRDTKNIFYFSNGLSIDDKKFHTLTFSIDKPKKTSTVFFSYCYPYTYTDLNFYLQSLLNRDKIDTILRTETLGVTLSGNKLEMLLITDFNSTFEDIAYRQAVILTSRVHPGESNASFVIEGVIDFLLDLNSSIARDLRKRFIFKIVPMLNPDGVINGNFRTCVNGKDLNRMWCDVRENMCPTIFYTKEMIKKTLQSREVFVFCDFHGHSNKNNFFLYGCNNNKKIKSTISQKLKTNGYQEMVLSRIYQSKNSYFDPVNCIYKIAQSKLKTARAVVKNEFNIDFSYCLESSIGSITLGENKNTFFTPEMYHKIGVDFCKSLLELSNKEIFTETLSKIQIEEAMRVVEISKDNFSSKNVLTKSTLDVEVNTYSSINISKSSVFQLSKVKKKAESGPPLNGKKKLKPLKEQSEKLLINVNEILLKSKPNDKSQRGSFIKPMATLEPKLPQLRLKTDDDNKRSKTIPKK
jgi:hypothetical protein